MTLRRKPLLWRSQGFTLVELLIVVGVIGLLSAMTLPALSRAKDAARQTSCMNRMRQWTAAMQLYCTDNEDYLPRESFISGGTTLNLWAQVRHPLASDVWYNSLPRALGLSPASDFAPAAVRADFYDRQQFMQCPAARIPAGAAIDPIAYFSIAMNSKLIRPGEGATIRIGAIRRPAATVAFLDNRLPDEPKVHPAQLDLDLGQPSAYASRFVTRHRLRGNLSFFDGHVEPHRGEEVVSEGYAVLPQTKVVWTTNPEFDPNLTGP